MARNKGKGIFGVFALVGLTVGAGAALGYYVIGGAHSGRSEPDAAGVQQASAPPVPSPAPKPPVHSLVHVAPNSDFTAPGAPRIHIVEDQTPTLDSPRHAQHPTLPSDTTATADIPTPDVEASQQGDGGTATTPDAPSASGAANTPASTSPSTASAADPEAGQTGTTVPTTPTTPAGQTTPDPETGQTGTAADTPASRTGLRAQYRIQAGSFNSAQDAQNYVNALQGKGVSASVSPQRQGGQTVYKVQVGAYHDHDAAEQAATGFRNQGVPVTVAPITP